MLGDHFTGNSRLEKSNRTLDAMFRFARVLSFFLSAPIFACAFTWHRRFVLSLLEFYGITHRTFVVHLSVFSRILAASLSLFHRPVTPPFFSLRRFLFFSPADTHRVVFSSPFGSFRPAFPATPHFPRNRFTFFPSPRRRP